MSSSPGRPARAVANTSPRRSCRRPTAASLPGRRRPGSPSTPPPFDPRSTDDRGPHHPPGPATAVVTGASSGIGAATARALAAAGFRVICAARRTDRIEALAAEIDGDAVTCDVTSADDVEALAAAVGDRLDVLVNNAGGALGLEPVHEGDIVKWRRMYEINVIGTLQVTKALLPAPGGHRRRHRRQRRVDRRAHGITTTMAYEGWRLHGGQACARRHDRDPATRAVGTDRSGSPRSRLAWCRPRASHSCDSGGDKERADKVTRASRDRLSPKTSPTPSWMATRPAHVNVDLLVIKPRAQAAPHKVDQER